MRSTLATVSALALGLCLVACRGGGGNSDDDDDDVDSGPGGVSIQEIQSDNMAPGTPVEVHGVVVVAIDTFGMRTGDIYVMEPEGGEFSGVHVFGAPVDKVAALAVGDIISIVGAEKDEFALTSDTSGRTITELKPVTGGMMDIVKTGTGSVPAPKVVDALAIGQLPTQAERDAEWEKWEGVLITVNAVTSFNTPACVGSACSDPMLKTVDVTGGLVLESALADFPAGIAKDGCLASATGIVDYFFDYLLYQRSAGDISTGGAGCPPAENEAAVCGDNIDNDGNGFKDCDDNNCVVGSATCRTETTISALQAAIPAQTGVELKDVYVTGLSFSKRDLWVSSSPTAAANSGIYVRAPGGSTAVDASVVIGSKVSIIGRASEANNDTMGETLTQVSRLAVNIVTAAPVPTVPVTGQTAATLTQAATGEPYESVLVTLPNVKVTAVGTSANFYVGEADQGGTKFLTDDDILRLVAADLNKCFTFIGIWTYQVFDNKYGLLPISKTETPCP